MGHLNCLTTVPMDCGCPFTYSLTPISICEVIYFMNNRRGNPRSTWPRPPDGLGPALIPSKSQNSPITFGYYLAGVGRYNRKFQNTSQSKGTIWVGWVGLIANFKIPVSPRVLSGWWVSLSTGIPDSTPRVSPLTPEPPVVPRVHNGHYNYLTKNVDNNHR